MQTRRLGSSGIDVPVVGMGTWKTFDVRGAGETARRREVVDVAIASGTNLFDSSPMYGAAEEVLGAALEARRDQVIVATKVWTSDDGEAERQIQNALRFFGGAVDLYQVHNLVAVAKRLRRLHELCDQGKVRAVGATHYQHSAFPELMDLMRSGQVSYVQVPYNVLDREVEKRVLPLAAEHNLGIIIMKPLDVGALTRKAPSVEQLRRFAEFGVQTWPQVLLKWLVSDPRVTTVIPATSNPEHAQENALAGNPPWFGEAERREVVRLAESL